MSKTPLVLLAVVISLSCSSSAPPPDAETTASAAESVAAAPGIPDSKIGLAASGSTRYIIPRHFSKWFRALMKRKPRWPNAAVLT